MDLAKMSLPSRERGLKSGSPVAAAASGNVAPLAGAWIEMSRLKWKYCTSPSLPSRERGLKCQRAHGPGSRVGRSPRRSVD